MISGTTLRRALNRIALLKYFPATNVDALAVTGEIVQELCQTDADVNELTQRLLATNDEWPGPKTLRETWSLIAGEHREAERAQQVRRVLAAATVARDAHEAGCSGHAVTLDCDNSTVSVSRCRQPFGEDPVEPWRWLRCRKGDAVDSELLDQILAAELSAHPGWLSMDEYFRRRWAARN
jgi:hypothetical protein